MTEDDLQHIAAKLLAKNVHVSIRGTAIRISPNVCVLPRCLQICNSYIVLLCYACSRTTGAASRGSADALWSSDVCERLGPGRWNVVADIDHCFDVLADLLPGGASKL